LQLNFHLHLTPNAFHHPKVIPSPKNWENIKFKINGFAIQIVSGTKSSIKDKRVGSYRSSGRASEGGR
jgi:hypothetical protein